MTLDELIKRLEEIKAEHGGDCLVYYCYDDIYEQVRDSDEIKYDYPYPDYDEDGFPEGVLIG